MPLEKLLEKHTLASRLHHGRIIAWNDYNTRFVENGIDMIDEEWAPSKSLNFRPF